MARAVVPVVELPPVEAPESPRIDGVLGFVAFVARSIPLSTLLDEAPRQMASILTSDVCSIYLLEGHHTLVMRGNIGFGPGALGEIRLGEGEGITGSAVQRGRPIRSDRADHHSHFKYFRELGEERFPSFLAVPILGKAGPIGAIVVQRKEVPYSDDDVALLTALAAPIAAGIRHADLLDEKRDVRRAGGGTRKVTLPGRPIVPGRALGAVAALRRPSPRPGERSSSVSVDEASSVEQERRVLKSAFDIAEKSIHALCARAESMGLGGSAGFLGTYREILTDMRFRERALEILNEGAGVAGALSQVAREATRTASSLTRDSFLQERAKDIEDLSDAIGMLAAGDKRAELPSKSVLIGDNLTVFDLLISARAQPVGAALSERASGRTRVLLELFAVPAIVDVQGLFRWAADGDIALLDADHGFLLLNPSKSEIAQLREHRRQSRRPVAG